jgi:hypothetical protein
MIEVAEVFRRNMWSVLRIEWEVIVQQEKLIIENKESKETSVHSQQQQQQIMNDKNLKINLNTTVRYFNND